MEYQFNKCRVISGTFTWHFIDWEAREAGRKFVTHGFLRYTWGSNEWGRWFSSSCLVDEEKGTRKKSGLVVFEAESYKVLAEGKNCGCIVLEQNVFVPFRLVSFSGSNVHEIERQMAFLIA